MNPSTVRVLLIPLDAHLELKLSAGCTLEEWREEILATSQPEEGLLENICLLLPEVGSEIHFLTKRAPVLRHHPLRDGGSCQLLEVILDILKYSLNVQILPSDMIE